MAGSGLSALTQLRLTRGQYERMRAHVNASVPLEACGLLAGKGQAVQQIITVENAAHSPVRFRMEPRQQLRALEWFDAHGLQLLGIFHSHPSGPEVPSPTDVAEAAYPVAHLIWSRLGELWTLHAFWIESGSVSEVKLDIAPGGEAR